MNPNPLFIKNFLMGEIPFTKNKTKSSYGRYISDHKLIKDFTGEGPTGSEVLTAYTMANNYSTDFVFDKADISPNIFFSDKEWIILGTLLRAYKEVEGINLLHLYNCLHSAEESKIYGYIVSGRTYTLYSSTRYPVQIWYSTLGEDKIVLPSVSRNSPYTFTVKKGEDGVEKIVKIELDFIGRKYPESSLFEGSYKGLSLKNIKGETPITETIPEPLRIGEYSNKLIEFFAGTLITDLSDDLLKANLERGLISPKLTLKEKIIDLTPGWFNKDGYLDRRTII